MTKTCTIVTVAIIAAVFAAPVSADAVVKRYLLSAGVNNGGNDRVLLRYAVTDANAFANVFIEMGGVEKNNAIISTDPSKRELLDGLANLAKLIANGKTADTSLKSEVFVYYSGHADETGLKLNGETLAWADFRNAVNNLAADVRVAVLDACGSGAITRAKGGAKRPAILSDASLSMKGYAFLTSSNEIEASQESDLIKGSYFTYALVSGMRGAADMTGDGKVTINEAYQYAFNETLQSTQNTKGGTQHPSRDMNLVGTGDIVMTDLRETNATLALDQNIEGRLFIRDKQGNLFAELHKARGRIIELGIPPGAYAVQMETPAKSWMAGNVIIIAGKKTNLAADNLKPMSGRKESVIIRGNGGERETPAPYRLNTGAVNISAGNIEKIQAGAVNISYMGINGVQAGAVNIAGNAGRQFGIVNIARRSGRTPIGLVNVIGNGIFDAAYYADACGDMGVSLRTGAAWLNTVFEYQQPAGGWGAWPKAWGLGVGTRFGMDGAFYVNLDAVWSAANYYTETSLDTILHPEWINVEYVDNSFCPSDGLGKLRFGANYRVLPFMAVTAGATVNALFEELYCRKERKISDGSKAPLNQAFNTGTMWGDYTIGDNGQKMRLWLSFYAGLTVGLPANPNLPKP